MKYIRILLAVYLLIPVILFSQTGSSCSTPYTLILDGVTRTYATTSNTGNAVVCSMSGSSPVTYFSLTTNASAQTPLLAILGPGGTNCEVAMYTGGSCSGGALQSASSMCFYDATGLWAPAETFTVTANTTYKLRIKTSAAGNISINARSYTPPNNTCSGATSIGPVPITDNNACHHPDLTVNASYLCAFTLENTAWYSFIMATTGTSTVNITNIECDNGDVNNSNGFQIGFFTGNCASLTPLTCASNSGSTVSASTSTLPAGTKVSVGIDGVAGANCQYQISATNSLALSAYLKYFKAEIVGNSNVLTWASLQEFNNDYYEIESSTDGKFFTGIGRVKGAIESQQEKEYHFDDNNARVKTFYRLKQVDLDGNIKYHNVVSVNRSQLPYMDLNFENPVTSNLLMNIETNTPGRVSLRMISMEGIVLMNETVNCKKGQTQFYKNFSTLKPGKYIIEATGDRIKTSRIFLKTYSSSGIK